MNFNGFASLAITHGIVRALPPDVADVYLRPFRPLGRRGIAAFYPGQITAATEYFAEVEAGLPAWRPRRRSFSGRSETLGFPAATLRGSKRPSRTTRRSSSPTRTTSSSKTPRMK